MIIDFKNIPEEEIVGFKGGEGVTTTRSFDDKDNKIMKMSLTQGASSGYHKHEGTCETVYILSGVGHFIYDGQREDVGVGSVHYCPEGHSHSMHNDGEEPLTYLAIVTTVKRTM